MARWGPVTVTGSGGWLMSGGDATNHEAFAFEPQSAAPNSGAVLTKVAVYNDTRYWGNTPTYLVEVQVVDLNGNPTADAIAGFFNSNEV
jgi:hypothetical protein